jgi:alpha-mannosidase
MAKEKVQIHYVASTHWDREWYYPFQTFRFLLVKLVDQLIDLLEQNPDYKYFVFDGQTVPLNDYVEARPENRPRLAKLIQSGRILVGPWYTLPDERILDGESFIRNIMRGYRDSADWGVKPMRYGYVCDIFGHIAQLPQILSGMGINHALLGRGTNEFSHPAHFVWRAPDGSEVVVFKEQDRGGYGAGRHVWSAAGADTGQDFDRGKIIEAARVLFEKEASRSDVPVQLWLDGVDHQRPGPRIPEALDVVRETFPEAKVVFSTLPIFAAAVEKYRASLPAFSGELASVARDDDGGFNYLISHCLSSHYPMKLANDRCQTALERWAEPFFVWASLLGKAPSQSFLDIAWQHVLQNHAHDSVCGCSIDQVHKDTEYRYDQAAVIAADVANDCQSALKPAEDKGVKALTLTVSNATPFAGKRVVTVDFDYPQDFTARSLTGFSDDRIPCFDLVDSAGKRIDYQLHRYIAPEEYLGLPAWGQQFSRPTKLRVFFEAEFAGIAAKNFTVLPREKAYRDLGAQRTGTFTAENEFLVLTANADGTITLTDKRGGRTFENLCVFEDTGDLGDGWFHVKPVHNETFLSTGFPTGVAFTDDGSLVTTFRMEKTLSLPAEFDWTLMRRSEERKPVPLTLDIILRKGAPYVECVAKLDNSVKDHRLRVLFASKVKGADYFANQPFTFVTRRRGIDRSTFDWRENDTEERGFCGIAGVSDAKGGLAIVAGEGLHEIAVKDDADATIAMTLMRAFKRTVLPPYGGRSELQHEMTFAWRIVPFAGKSDLAALTRLEQEFHSGVRVQAVRGRGAEAGTFAAMRKGDAILSGLKPAQNRRGVIVRVYNPTDREVTDALTFSVAFKSAVEVNHAEEPMRGAKALKGGRTLPIDLPPQRIRTFRLRFGKS